MTRMSKSSVREMIGEDGIHPTKNATGLLAEELKNLIMKIKTRETDTTSW